MQDLGMLHCSAGISSGGLIKTRYITTCYTVALWPVTPLYVGFVRVTREGNWYLGSVGGLKQDKETRLSIVACLLHQACQAGRGASI